ncbi:MAG: hypothetical protein QXS48_02170 [Candidatus Aenigmatarchaeota archaeon]
MSQLIKDGRKSQEKYEIIFRADEKCLLFPFNLSEEEMKELENEIKNFYEVERNYVGLKVITERGSVHFSRRLYGFEKRFAIESFVYGCAIEDFKKVANTAIQKTIVGEKLFGYWAKEVGKEEAEKRLKEITKD